SAGLSCARAVVAAAKRCAAPVPAKSTAAPTSVSTAMPLAILANAGRRARRLLTCNDEWFAHVMERVTQPPTQPMKDARGWLNRGKGNPRTQRKGRPDQGDTGILGHS